MSARAESKRKTTLVIEGTMRAETSNHGSGARPSASFEPTTDLGERVTAPGTAASEIPTVDLAGRFGIELPLDEARLISTVISRWAMSGTRTVRELEFIQPALKMIQRAGAVDLRIGDRMITAQHQDLLGLELAPLQPLRDLSISREDLDSAWDGRPGVAVSLESSFCLKWTTGIVEARGWALLRSFCYWGRNDARALVLEGCSLQTAKLLAPSRSRPEPRTIRVTSLRANADRVWRLMQILVELRAAYEAEYPNDADRIPPLLRGWTTLPSRLTTAELVAKGASVGERHIEAVTAEDVEQAFCELLTRIGWGKHEADAWPFARDMRAKRHDYRDFKHLALLIAKGLGLRREQIAMLDVADVEEDHIFKDGKKGWGLCVDGHKGAHQDEQRWIPLTPLQGQILLAWIKFTGRAYGQQAAPLFVATLPEKQGDPGRRASVHKIYESVAGMLIHNDVEKVIAGPLPLICRQSPWTVNDLFSGDRPSIGYSFRTTDGSRFRVLELEPQEDGAIVTLRRLPEGGSGELPPIGPVAYRHGEALRDQHGVQLLNPYIGYAPHEYRHGVCEIGDEVFERWKTENLGVHPLARAKTESAAEALVGRMDPSIQARYRGHRNTMKREQLARIVNREIFERATERFSADPASLDATRASPTGSDSTKRAVGDIRSVIRKKRESWRTLVNARRGADDSELRDRLSAEVVDLAGTIFNLYEELIECVEQRDSVGEPASMAVDNGEQRLGASKSTVLMYEPQRVLLGVAGMAQILGVTARHVRRMIQTGNGPWRSGAWMCINGSRWRRQISSDSVLRDRLSPEQRIRFDEALALGSCVTAAA